MSILFSPSIACTQHVTYLLMVCVVEHAYEWEMGKWTKKDILGIVLCIAIGCQGNSSEYKFGCFGCSLLCVICYGMHGYCAGARRWMWHWQGIVICIQMDWACVVFTHSHREGLVLVLNCLPKIRERAWGLREFFALNPEQQYHRTHHTKGSFVSFGVVNIFGSTICAPNDRNAQRWTMLSKHCVCMKPHFAWLIGFYSRLHVMGHAWNASTFLFFPLLMGVVILFNYVQNWAHLWFRTRNTITNNCCSQCVFDMSTKLMYIHVEPGAV